MPISLGPLDDTDWVESGIPGHLTTGEVLLAFTRYTETLRSIDPTAPLLSRADKAVHTAISPEWATR
jgi:hypothetical protein